MATAFFRVSTAQKVSSLGLVACFAAAGSGRYSVPAMATEAIARETSLRAGWGLRVTSIRGTPTVSPPRPLPAETPSNVPTRTRLAGFLPLVAVTSTDKHNDDAGEYCHSVHDEYMGTPLESPGQSNAGFAVFDTGSDIELFAGASAVALGLVGEQLTQNIVPLCGVGQCIDSKCSFPIGVFVAGLTAVDENGQLDTAQFVGHSNVSVLAAPPILCQGQAILSGVIGTSMISYFNSIIRVDLPQEATLGGVARRSPAVIMQHPELPLPTFSRRLLLEFAAPEEPASTACFMTMPFCGIPGFTPPCEPFLPTRLARSALDIPTGGEFLITIVMRQGEPGPTNPEVQMRMLFDSGSQVSAITPEAVVRLSLPNEPDFSLTLCGVGGTQEVPGYYIDYVRMSAQGGALEFSRAPVLVLSVPSPDGGPIDGVIGTNFFWNRNLILQPSLSGSGFLHLSDSIPFHDADIDADFDVDLCDCQVLSDCLDGPKDRQFHPICLSLDLDANDLVDLRDVATVQNAFHCSVEAACCRSR